MTTSPGRGALVIRITRPAAAAKSRQGVARRGRRGDPVVDDAPHVGEHDVVMRRERREPVEERRRGRQHSGPRPQARRAPPRASCASAAGASGHRRSLGRPRGLGGAAATGSTGGSAGFAGAAIRRGIAGCDALQGRRAHRPGRRKQMPLAEADIVVEQVDDHALGLDLFRDQVDAESARAGRRNRPGGCPRPGWRG